MLSVVSNKARLAMAIECQNSEEAETCGVLLMMNDEAMLPQAEDFHCCGLGTQFCTEKQLENHSVLNIRMAVPDGDGSLEIDCSGVVVHSEPADDSDCFRTWVYFLDLPQETTQRLRLLSKNRGLTCPFCENC